MAEKATWLDAQSMLGFVRVSQEYPKTAEQAGCKVVMKNSIE